MARATLKSQVLWVALADGAPFSLSEIQETMVALMVALLHPLTTKRCESVLNQRSVVEASVDERIVCRSAA